MKGVIQVLKSVGSAMVGVGKKTDLEKDFQKAEEQGPWSFIIAGLIGTVIFIMAVVMVVQFVLP